MSLQISPIFNRSLLSRLLFSFVILFGLAACGGGGGGGSSSITLSVAPASITESDSGSANLSFTVTLSAASGSNVTLAYTTADDSAAMGEDYTFTSGTLTIPANSTSATIDVPVLGDTNVELDETFNLTISSAQGASIANGSMTVAGTIVSDDTLAGYYTGSVSVNEGMGTLNGSVQVIADSDLLVIADLTNDLAYVAPISTLASGTFTGTARAYKDGDFARTVNVSAIFTAGSTITLTLSGSGDYSSGSVTLSYSLKNSDAPIVMNNSDSWVDANGGFLANSNSNIYFSFNAIPSTSLSFCEASNVSVSDVVSEQTGRIRNFSTATTSCVAQTADGYFTWFDDSVTDDAVLFMFYNDDGFHAAQLN